jgi:hypothetical protein
MPASLYVHSQLYSAHPQCCDVVRPLTLLPRLLLHRTASLLLYQACIC